MSSPTQQDLQKLSGIKQLLGRWISELRTRFEELKEEVRYADNHEFLVEHAKKLAQLMATLQIDRKNSAAALQPMLKIPPPKSMPADGSSTSAPPPRPPPPLPRIAGMKLTRKRGSSQAIQSDMLVAARRRMSVRSESQATAVSGTLKGKYKKPPKKTPKTPPKKPILPPPKTPVKSPQTPPKKHVLPKSSTPISMKIHQIERNLSEHSLRSSAPTPIIEETRAKPSTTPTTKNTPQIKKVDSPKDSKKSKSKKDDKDHHDKKKELKEDKKKESKDDKKKDKEDKSHKNKDKKKKDKSKDRKADRLTKSADAVDSDPELLSAPDSIKKLVKNGGKPGMAPLQRSNSSDVSAKMKHKRLNTPKGKRKHKPVGAIDWDPGTDIVF